MTQAIARKAGAIVAALVVVTSLATIGGVASSEDLDTQANGLATTSISIQQHAGTTTSDGFNTTRQVKISTDTKLAFDNGSNYYLQFTNNDTGGSVTLAVNASFNFTTDDSLAFMLYGPRGTPQSEPQVWYLNSTVGSPFYNVSVVSGSIPSASGTTNFSVSLVNASSGNVVAQTASLPSVVGYAGTLAQNSTSGIVRLDVPRDVVPQHASVQLELEKRDGSTTHLLDMQYVSSPDEFVATIDADNFSAGNYSWRVLYALDGFQILQVHPDPLTAKQNVTLEGETATSGEGGSVATNVSIQQIDFITTAWGLNESKLVGIAANKSLTLDNGTNYEFQLTNEDTGNSVTVVIDGSAELNTDEVLALGVYRGDGQARTDPWLGVGFSSFPAVIVNGSVPAGTGLKNYSVRLLAASDGSEIARTETHGAVLNYSGTLTQNSTTGTIQVSIPRDVVPTTAAGTFVLRKRDDSGSIVFRKSYAMTYDSGSDAFVTEIDATNLSVGNYSAWKVVWTLDGVTILQHGPDLASENVTISGVPVRGQVIEAGGAAGVNDSVVLIEQGAQSADFAADTTDSSGNYTVEVAKNTTHDVQYYQFNFFGNDSDPFARDDSPDLFALGRVDTAGGGVDMGQIQLPTAFTLNITVVNESGDPVENASVGISHLNSSDASDAGLIHPNGTNADGMYEHGFTGVPPGIEVVGNVSVEVRPPRNETRFVNKTYVRNLTMTSDTGITVTLEENVTVTPTIEVENESTLAGQETTLNITLSEAPEGVAGFNISVSVDNTSVAEITGAELPFNESVTSTKINANNDTVRLKAVDLENKSIKPGDTNIMLAKVTLSGLSSGTANVTVNVAQMDDDNGSPITPAVVPGTLTVEEATGMATNVSLDPSSGEVAITGTTHFDVVVENVTGGIGAYSAIVTTGDVDKATVVDVELHGSPGLSSVDFADDNSSVSIDSSLMDTNDTARVIVATVTVRGNTTGMTAVGLSVGALGNESGVDYTILSVSNSTINITAVPTICNFDNPPTDPDGDGLYENINGNDEFNIVDIQAMFANRDCPDLVNHPEFFDFSGDGDVDIVDIQALFVEETS